MKKTLFSLFLILVSTSPLLAQWDLNHCLEYALANNKELLGQQQQIAVSHYSKMIAIDKFMPHIQVSMESNYYWKMPVQSYPGELVGLPEERITIATGSKYAGEYTIHVNWRLLDIQQWHNLKLEKLKVQAAAYGVESLQKLLSKNVEAAFYNLQIQRKNLSLSDSWLAQHRQIHTLLTNKFKEGLLNKIDWNQSTSILAQYEKYKSEQELDYQKSLLDLKYWMGYPMNKTLDIQFDHAFKFLINITEFKFDQLPDYKQQQAIRDIAYQNLQASTYFMLPQLSFVSSFGQIGFGEQFRAFSNLSKWHNNGYIGFRLQIPVFVLEGIHTVKRNRAMYKQAAFALAAYGECENKKFLQLRLDLQRSRNRLFTQEGIRKLAEENLVLCNQKISEGVINMVQLLQVQQELLNTIEQENTAQLDYLKSQLELNYLQNEL